LNNPYIIDRPLTTRDWFVGREQTFSLLIKRLSEGERMVILCGRRYSGKTSFINQLPNYLSESYRLAIIDLSPSEAIEDPLWTIFEQIAAITQKPLPDKDGYLQDAYSFGLNYLRQVCGQGTRNVMLFCLDAVSVKAFTPGSRWEAIVNTLLDIIASLPSAAFLLVVEGHHLDIKSAVIQALPILTLHPLDNQEVEDLVGVPARSNVAYDFELIRQAGVLAGNDPFILQIIARLLYENRANNSWLGPNALDKVVRQAEELAEPAFYDLWEEATPQAQTILATFAAMTGHHGVGSADDLTRYLRHRHVVVPKGDVEAGITYLADRGYLQKLGSGVYQFKSELFRLWVREQHPLQQVLSRHRLYKRTRPKKPAPWRGIKVDWFGVALWSLAIGLLVGIVYIWQARNTNLFRMTPFQVSKQTAIPTAGAGLDTSRNTVIVFQSRATSDSNWVIARINNDGTEKTVLTDGEANDMSPVISPDGSRIAFVSDRDGNREIYVMNADGTNPVNLTRHVAEDWTPAWSPDGRYIAFSSFRDSNWELYVMRSDGSEVTRLTENVFADYSPSWSPDGTKLAYVSDRDGNLEIYTKPLDSPIETRITNNPATDQSPAWSPNGMFIAFASYRDGNMEIYVANADGSNPQNVTEDPISDDQAPAWAFDSLHLVFHSNRDHNWDIYTLEITTGRRQNLTSSPEADQFPHWGK